MLFIEGLGRTRRQIFPTWSNEYKQFAIAVENIDFLACMHFVCIIRNFLQCFRLNCYVIFRIADIICFLHIFYYLFAITWVYDVRSDTFFFQI